MVVVDFETHGIEGMETPEPVGVAIWWPKKGEPRYYAWGHPTKNNCTKDTAARALRDAWKASTIIMHNAKFDLKVGMKFFDLLLPAWDVVHDTMFLSFLKEPHKTSSLKETAERELGEAPTERDALGDWLVEQKIIPKKYSKENLGRNIWRTPGDLAGKYAIGDVTRTFGLWVYFLPTIRILGMEDAYNRERRLLPILITNEAEGMRLDMDRLGDDLPLYEKALLTADAWVRKRLKAPSLNVDSADELATLLKSRKIVTDFVKTKTGKDSISKKNLTFDMYKDKELASVLAYRGPLVTLLSNSMRPWLAQAQENHGIIATEWNQVKAVDRGTRSGRLSCSRFQNIAKSFEGTIHPTVTRLPPLPLVRRYILPDRNHTFVHRDYNQQEFRILAHFEDGELLAAYQTDPHLDYHTKMRELIFGVAHMSIERKLAKILNFGINYGMGIAKLAVDLGLTIKYACKLGCPHKDCKAAMEARLLRNAQKKAVPGVAELNRDLMDIGRGKVDGKDYIATWGGRRYKCEDPKRDGDRILQTYEYKLLNYLIQGSAADCTKEAIIRYHEHPKKNARFLVTVHDEINISAPRKAWFEQDAVLREAMESMGSDQARRYQGLPHFNLPMLTDGKVGANWGELIESKKLSESPIDVLSRH